MNRTPVWFAAAGITLMTAVFMSAADLTVNTASSPYAPMDISKKDESLVPLSRSQRQDLIKEFKGLVAMGMQNHSFEHWSWKNIADCYEPERTTDRWMHKCEILTGQGNGIYYFFEGEARRGVSTLQRVEVHLQTSDRNVIDELKPSLRDLFGRSGTLVTETSGYRTVGPVRHWNTGSDVADLF